MTSYRERWYAIMDAAEKAYSDTCELAAKTLAATRGACFEIHCSHCVAAAWASHVTYIKARDDYNAALRDGWNGLSEGEKDPIKVWVIEHCFHDRADALVVLHLPSPVTTRAICDVAIERGWCSEFDRYVDEAVRDGAIPSAKDFERIVRGIPEIA
jgi:hypothetical protein